MDFQHSVLLEGKAAVKEAETWQVGWRQWQEVHKEETKGTCRCRRQQWA